MALTAEEAKELKQLKNINSPVLSQRKRILQLQQFKNIKRREIPKKPKVTPITNEYSEGNFGKPSTKKINNKKNSTTVSSTEEKRRKTMKNVVPAMRKKKKELQEKREQNLASTYNQGTGKTMSKKPAENSDDGFGKKKKVNNKPKTTTSPSLNFLTPKGKKQFSSILSKLKKMIGPKERITSTKIKKNLPKDETYSKKQVEQLRVALTPSDKRKSPGHPSIRAKAPVVKKKVTSTGKKKLNANELEKLNKIKPRGPKPNQPAKITSKRTQDEKDAGAGKFTGGGRTKAEKDAGAGKFTGKTPGYTPRGNKESMNRTKETKKAAPKKESFLGFEKISGPKGIFLGPTGVRKMKTPFGGTIELDSTPIEDREDRKVGGKVSKKKGGMIKRNMGGPAKPRKKVVFRRGGGKALRGFGKATYSNKMY